MSSFIHLPSCWELNCCSYNVSWILSNHNGPHIKENIHFGWKMVVVCSSFITIRHNNLTIWAARVVSLWLITRATVTWFRVKQKEREGSQRRESVRWLDPTHAMSLSQQALGDVCYRWQLHFVSIMSQRTHHRGVHTPISFVTVKDLWHIQRWIVMCLSVLSSPCLPLH